MMCLSSDDPNYLSSTFIRMGRGDVRMARSYHRVMPRKAPSPIISGPDWFLPEWMDTLRVTQAALARETGWSKATMNDIFHGKTSYYRQILNDAARALRIEPFELLMPPAAAMAIKNMRNTAIRIAADTRLEYHAEPRRDGANG